MAKPHWNEGNYLPWTSPFRDWSDKELERGLEACDDYEWKNLRRGIEGEQKVRLAEELAA